MPKAAADKSPDAAWAEAVIANVNNQVEVARKRFSKQIQAGQLTVVGAVYDFRNDLQLGAGKLAIVNVNGNSEPERMTAFVEAVTGNREGKVAKEGKEKDKKHKGAKEEPATVEDTAAQLARLRAEAGVQVRTASVEPKAAEHGHPEHAAHAD